MIEVSPDSDYVASTQLTENKGARGQTQLSREELSSIDYKTQALVTFFLGGFSGGDFYAGNHLLGLAKLAISLVTGGILIPVIELVSLITLSKGNYTDAKGKVIRQVVHLKKEELSSCDHTISLILCTFLGTIGVHQFYAGKPLKGMLMLCSLGGLGIWQLINIYQLVICDFKDGQGKTICPDYIKLATKG